jgi:hypothetical protein
LRLRFYKAVERSPLLDSQQDLGGGGTMKRPIYNRLVIGHAILSLACFHGELFSGTALQYLSPRPGALLVSPETNIIIRLGEPLDRSTLKNSSFITVVGSTSGLHSGRVRLSDDEKTIVFNPRDPFTAAETVTVNLHSGVRITTGKPVDTLEFNFVVSPRKIVIDPMYSLVSELKESYQSQTQAKALPLAQQTQKNGPSAPTGDGLPSDFPELTILASNNPSPGKIFIANFDLNNISVPYLMILDNTAKPIFYRKMNGNCLDFMVQPNGLLTYWDTSLGYFIALDSLYNVVDSFKCGNGYSTDLHELRILPDGHALLLSYDPETVDMSQVVPGGDPTATVIGLIIQELDREKNVVFQWRSWDHFQITDATHENLLASTIDYVHGNTIELDNDGNIFISSRYMDEITKINRRTGDIMWRMGGKNNQFTFINDPIGFSHQHAIRRLPNGNITLFDNGNFHSPSFSRAVEYQLDEQNKTVTLVWQFRNSPDNYGYAMGNIQRLDNGNTMIGWGTSNPTLTEVRPDGTKAFELNLPEGNYSYRAFRFPWKETAPLASTTQPVNQTGVVNLNLPGSETAITMNFTKLVGSGTVTVKRYGAAPNAPSFSGTAPELLEQMRWVISQTGFTDFDGQVIFNFSAIPEFSDPTLVTAYNRPSEGIGQFNALPTSYDVNTNQITVPMNSLGEFAFGSRAYVISSVHGSPTVGGGIPDHFALQQNYPNPFNPSTTIEYQIPADAVVDIGVYNILGQEVRSLVEGFQTAGFYRVVFDAVTLPSGVYFYRLNASAVSGGKAGGFQETKKLVLLR